MMGGDVAGWIEPEVAGDGEEAGMLTRAVVVERAGLVGNAGEGRRSIECRLVFQVRPNRRGAGWRFFGQTSRGGSSPGGN
jgi:hypothetical protein